MYIRKISSKKETVDRIREIKDIHDYYYESKKESTSLLLVDVCLFGIESICIERERRIYKEEKSLEEATHTHTHTNNKKTFQNRYT